MPAITKAIYLRSLFRPVTLKWFTAPNYHTTDLSINFLIRPHLFSALDRAIIGMLYKLLLVIGFHLLFVFYPDLSFNLLVNCRWNYQKVVVIVGLRLFVLLLILYGLFLKGCQVLDYHYSVIPYFFHNLHLSHQLFLNSQLQHFTSEFFLQV